MLKNLYLLSLLLLCRSIVEWLLNVKHVNCVVLRIVVQILRQYFCRLSGVYHDGGGLPSYSKGLPMLPSIRGRSAKGSPCPIRVYALLELVHLDYTSIESTMELNKPPMVKNVLVMTDIHEVCPCCGDKGPNGQNSCKGVLPVLHSDLWSTC